MVASTSLEEKNNTGCTDNAEGYWGEILQLVPLDEAHFLKNGASQWVHQTLGFVTKKQCTPYWLYQVLFYHLDRSCWCPVLLRQMMMWVDAFNRHKKIKWLLPCLLIKKKKKDCLHTTVGSLWLNKTFNSLGMRVLRTISTESPNALCRLILLLHSSARWKLLKWQNKNMKIN